MNSQHEDDAQKARGFTRLALPSSATKTLSFVPSPSSLPCSHHWPCLGTEPQDPLWDQTCPEGGGVNSSATAETHLQTAQVAPWDLFRNGINGKVRWLKTPCRQQKRSYLGNQTEDTFSFRRQLQFCGALSRTPIKYLANSGPARALAHYAINSSGEMTAENLAMCSCQSYKAGVVTGLHVQDMTQRESATKTSIFTPPAHYTSTITQLTRFVVSTTKCSSSTFSFSSGGASTCMGSTAPCKR